MDWNLAFARLADLQEIGALWRSGQDKSIGWLRSQLATEPGVLIADEVGLGKTRLAVAVAACVAQSGGRVAIVIPPGLTYQWRDEELPRFLKQAQELDLPDLKGWQPRTRLLRKYMDLFQADKGFPVSADADITFISHTFGLPYTSKAKREELWALPFMLKKRYVGGNQVRGAGMLDIGAFQDQAVRWLEAHGTKETRDKVLRAPLGKLAPQAFALKENEKLFEDLVGQLVGEFDLLIIDEAHKNRAGSDISQSEKKSETVRASRLTRLLDNILVRPEAHRTRAAKRLALTATPMEMDAEQWTTIFNRLGLDVARINSLRTSAKGFEKAVKSVRVGSALEIATLTNAASEFSAQLAPLVTRRLWRDDPIVQRYAQATGRGRVAHPHRETIDGIKKLSTMPQRDRTFLAFTEALSTAARGSEVSFDIKTTGSRFSQALPIRSESPHVEALGGVDSRRSMRIAYWQRKLSELNHEYADVSGRDRWSLQWHPRVRYAVDLVENLARAGRKVLVFGEFIESLRALERSLNIRHYLRHIGEGHAIPLPRDVSVNDPDLLRWLKDPGLRVDLARHGDFETYARKMNRTYESDRAHLRDLCRDAVEKHCGLDLLQPLSRDTLVTWLVQQLCSQNLLWAVGDAQGKGHAYETALSLLHSIHDPDPPSEDEENAGTATAVTWNKIIEQLSEDLQRDANGFVFRMSPFAQLLIGDTKPATRRARQGAFNNSNLNPQVLIGQSDVMSEGLNLHLACRDVVLFHLDWNPGRIEQQIGRVDRQGSDWMVACNSSLEKGLPLPTINVHTIAIEGTYDDLRTAVVTERAQVLRSQLFGEIIPAAQLATLSQEAQQEIGKIDIDFRPPTPLDA